MSTAMHRFKAEFFKALAHPSRIQILEILRQGEQTVSELQARLEIDASSVSQHLSILRGRQIIEGRKVGTSVFYRVLDDQLFTILDAARAIFGARVQGLQGILHASQEDEAQQTATPGSAPAVHLPRSVTGRATP
jgi:ArsR family transcriptional regulator